VNEFIIDDSGGVAVKFEKHKYIQVIPVTKYQFERFIWQTGSCWDDYNQAIKDLSRISPQQLNKQKIINLFARNICFEDAQRFCKHFKARIPTKEELDRAYKSIFQYNILFQEVLSYIRSQRHKKDSDARIIKIIEAFVKIRIIRKGFGTLAGIGELVSEFSDEPYGRIYARLNNEFGLVTGNPSTKSKDPMFVFSCIIEMEK